MLRMSPEKSSCNNPCCDGCCNVITVCASDIRDGAVFGAWTLGGLPWGVGRLTGCFLECMVCSQKDCCSSWLPIINLPLPIPSSDNCSFVKNLTGKKWHPDLGRSTEYEMGSFEFVCSTLLGTPSACVGGALGGIAGAIKSLACCPCSFFAGIKNVEQKRIMNVSNPHLNQLEDALIDESRSQRGKWKGPSHQVMQ